MQNIKCELILCLACLLLKSLIALSCSTLSLLFSTLIPTWPVYFFFALGFFKLPCSFFLFLYLLLRFSASHENAQHLFMILKQSMSFKLPKLWKSLKRSQHQLWRSHRHQKVPKPKMLASTYLMLESTVSFFWLSHLLNVQFNCFYVVFQPVASFNILNFSYNFAKFWSTGGQKASRGKGSCSFTPREEGNYTSQR